MGFLDDILSGVGTVGSDLLSGIGTVGGGLNTAAQGLGNYFGSPGGNLLSGLGTLGLGAFNSWRQNQIQQDALNNAKQSINPQTWENIRQRVEGQQMGATGSGTPALIGANEAIADYSVMSQQLQNQLAALKAAAGMQSPTGSLEQLIAQLTGGLGHQYAMGAGSGATNPFGGASNPLADNNIGFGVIGDPSNIDPMTGLPATTGTA